MFTRLPISIKAQLVTNRRLFDAYFDATTLIYDLLCEFLDPPEPPRFAQTQIEQRIKKINSRLAATKDYTARDIVQVISQNLLQAEELRKAISLAGITEELSSDIRNFIDSIMEEYKNVLKAAALVDHATDKVKIDLNLSKDIRQSLMRAEPAFSRSRRNSDPISDMLMHIRNALMIGKKTVEIPNSKIKVEIARILSEEGYIEGYSVGDEKPFSLITITLKYYGERRERKPAILNIQRVSKPGRRVYRGRTDQPLVSGIVIVTTPKGVMTERQAKSEGLPSEIILYVK